MERIGKKKDICIKLAHILEIVLAILVMVVVILGIFDMLRIIWEAYIIDFNNPVEYSQLNTLLGQILMLVIGVELVVMLCLHKTETLLDVLMYAIARKLLLVHTSNSIFEILLGVIAIGGIFAIKRHLVNLREDNNNEDLKEAIEIENN